MLKAKSFLGVDFGAGSLKVAEFEITESGALCLKQFGVRPLGLEGSQESTREGAIGRALPELIGTRGFAAKNFNACAPGFHVFSKFVKLPPVDTAKVTQIIQYEAQQNVPFPLDEVVWDYQITGTAPNGELEVFLVAIKSDIVEGLFRTASAAGLRLQLVDVSPASLCNAFRYNYPDLESCTMLLDIGAKTSNVLFFEKGKYSSRGINIGANSITQDFMAEVRMPFSKAEQFKLAEGFVSLGGAYEEPENPQQAQISKIARQVMTRLHIQVNQTIQFYRGQQGGGAPQRLLLAGGASIMPYTAQFFSEKLGLPVEYFNPLRNVQIDPSVNLEELAKVAHSLGEVVGLGLRNLAQCPIELNLMPKTIRKRQELNQKKPYFVATILSVVLALLAMGWFYDARVVAPKRAAIEQLQTMTQPLQAIADQINQEKAKVDQLLSKANQESTWVQDRIYWLDILKEVREALLQTEQYAENELLKKRGPRAGIWIEKMVPEMPQGQETEAAAADPATSRGPTMIGWSEEMKRRYGLISVPTPQPEAGAEGEGEGGTPKATNEISNITLTCKAVTLKEHGPALDADIAHYLEKQLQNRTNLFDPATALGRNITPPEENSVTFSFEVKLKLKRPITI